MGEVTVFAILSWVLIPLFLIFQPTQKFKLPLLLAFSVYFLFYNSVQTAVFTAILLWIIGIYFLQKKISNNFSVVATYVFVAISTFIFLKLDILSTYNKNSLLEVAMPLGFSFIMFQSIALLIDRNQKTLNPVSAQQFFASFLFFPTFLAGPFYKIQDFQKSIFNDWSGKRIFHGYCLFCLGLFKFSVSGYLLKPALLVSMPLRPHPHLHSANLLLLGSIYIYSNFSGLSDMVVGVAKLFGIDIPLNFKFPYLSRTVAEYWRNWHITLGAWFREYVYYPLNYYLTSKFSSRVNKEFLQKFSVFFTFFLIGMWHQFSLKTFFYAFFNSFLLAFFNPKGNWYKPIGIPVTFLLILLINGIFLSENVETFLQILRNFVEISPQADLTMNLKIGLLGLTILVLYYFSEKIVDKGSDYTKDQKNLFVAINFLMCIFFLFIGITFGLSGVDAVYVGY